MKTKRYPTNGEDSAFNTMTGLTKREYFAAMAMQGLCADNTYPKREIIMHSVIFADALINELNKSE